jgi:transposase-like protein
MLGLDVGDPEDGAFWTALVHGQHAQGPAGVKLVVSDAR